MSIRKQPPPRVITNYTLTADISSTGGLTNVPHEKFTKLISPGYDATRYYPTPVHTTIGFDFGYVNPISNTTVMHNRMVVTPYGYVVLVDESEASTDPATILARVMSGPIDNSAYLNSGLNSADTVLCPWFTRMQLLYDDCSQVNNSDLIVTIGKKSDFEYGIVTEFDLSPLVNKRQGGVWIKKCDESPEGMRTIVRWYARPDEYDGFGRPLLLELINQIVFECVIYENGKIEFRYAPMKKAFDVPPATTTATFNTGSYVVCGVFPGSSISNALYRDFSTLHPDLNVDKRRSELGGSVYDTVWLDSTGGENTVYSHSMTTSRNWFGRTKFGATLTFSPPKSLNVLLPRKSQRLLDRLSAGSEQVDFTSFDDRHTINFISGVVNMPSRLPRFAFGNTQLSTDFLDMLTSDFFLTASVAKNVNEQLTQLCTRETCVAPYSENRLFTLSTNTSSFYSSSVTTIPGFTNQLRDKTQIRLAFSINNPTKLLVTASVLYYDTTKQRFQVIAPEDLQTTTSIDGGAPLTGETWINNSSRLFSPFGTAIVSGSLLSSLTDQQGDTSTFFGTMGVLSADALYKALQSHFSRNVLSCQDYEPSPQQTFRLPIEDPFLVEKVIIDVPIEAGPGWFNDSTRYVPFYGGGASPEDLVVNYDPGGPGLTFSLLHSVKVFNGNVPFPSASYRNIVANGTLTHYNDATSSIEIIPMENLYGNYGKTLSIRGLSQFIDPSIIDCSNTNFYTGSAKIEMRSNVCNGIGVACLRNWVYTDTGTTLDNNLKSIFCERFIDASSYLSINTWTNYIPYVNPFQRNNRGLTLPTDGRSIMGGQFASPQPVNVNDVTSYTFVKNPFFVNEDLDKVPAYLKEFGCGSTVNIGMPAIGFMSILEGSSESPYLIYPNDDLVISLAKSRPSMSGSMYRHDHDIKISQGTMYVTIYGSYVKQQKEVHEVSRRINDSRSVYASVLGNDPVLDQYEVESSFSFLGSTTDAYITGSLVTRVPEVSLTAAGSAKTTLITGSRGKVFSKTLWFDNRVPFSGSEGSVTRLQSTVYDISQKYAGMQTSLRLLSDNERFYDSLMPGINEIMKADGSQILRYSVATALIGGILVLDWPKNIPGDRGDTLHSNSRWFDSFPFEPRYSSVKRYSDISKSFISNNTTNFSSIVPASPKIHDGLWCFTMNDLDPSAGENYFIDYDWQGGAAARRQMTKESTTKFFFGYARSYSRKSGTRSGVTMDFMSNNRPIGHTFPGAASTYRVAPEIQGWKYGIYNGFPTYTSCVWRRGRYGQFRDMLEQRQDSKMFMTSDSNKSLRSSYTGQGVVTIRFVDRDGNQTNPENTWSSNLSLEATSSLPYFDGEVKNRAVPNSTKMNLGIVTMNQDLFGNLKV